MDFFSKHLADQKNFLKYKINDVPCLILFVLQARFTTDAFLHFSLGTILMPPLCIACIQGVRCI